MHILLLVFWEVIWTKPQHCNSVECLQILIIKVFVAPNLQMILAARAVSLGNSTLTSIVQYLHFTYAFDMTFPTLYEHLI